MLFVISPAKTLDFETPARTGRHTLPRFVAQSAELIELLRPKSIAELTSMMGISEPLAALNMTRYQAWRPEFTSANSKQAVLAFMGDVYEGLDAASLDDASLDHAQARLRILSGLYGVLRPLDRIQPYRLEMGTPLATTRGRGLYRFWGARLTESLNADLAVLDQPVLINLASEEYFKAIQRACLNAQVVQCVFEERKGDRFKIVSFHAKRARGLMARFALQHRIACAGDLRTFDLEGYRFAQDASAPERLVFRRDRASNGICAST